MKKGRRGKRAEGLVSGIAMALKPRRARKKPPAQELEDLTNALAAKTAANPPPRNEILTGYEADAIIKLIREAKREGVSIFEGPNGLKFAFRREAARANQPKEERDDWI